MQADPDEALQGAGWLTTGGGAFGEKGAPLQALSFGECPHYVRILATTSLDLNAFLASKRC